MTAKHHPEDQSPDQSPDQNLPAEVQSGQNLPAAQSDAVMLVRQMMEQVPTVDEDPTESMMQAIMLAESPAEMEAIWEAKHLKDSVGARVTLHTFRVADSDYEGRFGKYLLCDVTVHASGERTVMTCGAELAMVQLLWYWKRGLLPYDFEIVAKAKPTKAGFTPLRFRPLGRPRGWIGDTPPAEGVA